MYRAATAAFNRADGAVMCAAVADYTPETCADRKLKKGDGELTIRLRRTKDIAAELGSRKGGRVLVGFALETDDEGGARPREAPPESTSTSSCSIRCATPERVSAAIPTR